MKDALKKYPEALGDEFMKAGIRAKSRYATFDEAAEADEDQLTELAKKHLDRPLTQWDAMVLGTAYKLGYEIARS